MKKDSVIVHGLTIPVYSCNTVVVGSGAAGFNAAARLFDYGVTDIALVTEKVKGGTSRNTGSDKQTYYKLSLSGKDPDSVYSMAETLFSGGCMDGDIALCEAALSSECFMRLVDLGVPFPRTRYGEFIGYKTDHDPYRRATSVGPYTSRMMTEKLEAFIHSKGIPVFDRHQVIRILTAQGQAVGLLCFVPHSDMADGASSYAIFRCHHIIYATGGPAAMYAESVYPGVHFGASGLAFEAGAQGRNLTEWQYGLASVRPRWNVSGTYMQVMPRFISLDTDGGDEKEFLMDFFTGYPEMLSKVFMKGYQWPFDVRKVMDQSSIIDILVYAEQKKGRRVFLDFRSNPGGEDIDFSSLDAEARDYLQKAEACFGTPFERLSHMNRPAVDFYLAHGVDLSSEPLEIALCAQHNNGGLGVDCWWQTSLPGLFAAGEVAGTHGVYRPGGTALNAGQVGSQRASQYISRKGNTGVPDPASIGYLCMSQIEEMVALGQQAVDRSQPENARNILSTVSREMSLVAGPFRRLPQLEAFLEKIDGYLADFSSEVHVGQESTLSWVFRLRDVLLSQKMYVSAMIDYIRKGGQSRGSALYTDPEGQLPKGLAEDFRFVEDTGEKNSLVQEMKYEAGACQAQWRTVNPLPEDDSFFENVWRLYRENQNIW